MVIASHLCCISDIFMKMALVLGQLREVVRRHSRVQSPDPASCTGT